MNDMYVVAIDGLSADRPLEALPERVKRNAVRAVNYAAARERTRGARQIREQVAFRASDLGPAAGKFTVDTAKSIDGQAEIRAHFRPTSLAKFATRGAPRTPGVSLMVKPGLATRSNRMFLIRLRAGSADLDTKSNLGVAIRLKQGETVTGKKVQLQRLGNTGLYLLYGPSISQIYRSVAEGDLPEVEQDLEREFKRLMDAGV